MGEPATVKEEVKEIKIKNFHHGKKTGRRREGVKKG